METDVDQRDEAEAQARSAGSRRAEHVDGGKALERLLLVLEARGLDLPPEGMQFVDLARDRGATKAAPA